MNILEFPEQIIKDTFKLFSGINIKPGRCRLIYSRLEDLQLESNNRHKYLFITNIDPNKRIIELDFVSAYVKSVFNFFQLEKENKILVDIGSWNPYGLPTKGQFLMTCHIDKIIRMKCLIERSIPLKIFCINDNSPRISKEIDKIRDNTSLMQHPEFIKYIVNNNKLSKNYKMNLLSNYYVERFKEKGGRVGIYWDRWIYQSNSLKIFINEKYSSIKKLKQCLKKGLNRDEEEVIYLEYNNQKVVIYNVKRGYMYYAGNDLVNMIMLHDEYNENYCYLCVAQDHKFYSEIVETMSSFLNSIDIPHAKYILLHHPKTGYYDINNTLQIFSKSKGYTGQGVDLQCLDNITWLHHFSLIYNTQKEIFKVEPNQQHMKVLRRITQLNNILLQNYTKQIPLNFIFMMHKLHTMYRFNQLNVFEEMISFVEATKDRDALELLRILYQNIIG